MTGRGWYLLPLCMIVSEVILSTAQLYDYINGTVISLNSSQLVAPKSYTVDRNPITVWKLDPNQTTDSVTATFSTQAVHSLKIDLGNNPLVKPNSIRIRLVAADNVTHWVVYVNKTCTDQFLHWRNDNELTQCVKYNDSGVTRVNATTGVFFVVDRSNAKLLWWQPFNRVELSVYGTIDDFIENIENSTNFFSINDLILYGFLNSAYGPCNCDPYSRSPLNATCISSDSCRCANTQNQSCKPVVHPIDSVFDAYFGPVSGGTVIELNGTFPSQPFVLIGGLIPCTVLNDRSNNRTIVCVASTASHEYIGKRTPLHVCWNITNVITPSCVITRDEFTYRPDPVISGLSRTVSLAKGGLRLTVVGENFDSLYGFSGNAVNAWTNVYKGPFVNILVSLLQDVRYPTDENDQANRCTVIDKTNIQCTTPEVTENVDNYMSPTLGYKIYLEVCLGLYADIISIYSGKTNCSHRLNFMVIKTPTIYPFTEVYLFRKNNGDPYVKISADNFLACCVQNDYNITIGGQPCIIVGFFTNSLSCQPPPQSDVKLDSSEDSKASRVILYVGDYSFSVGSLRYVNGFCDDPSNNCAALIGGIVGGVGGGLLLLTIIIVIVCVVYRRRRKEKERQRHELLQDPVNHYISDPSMRLIPAAERDELVDRIQQDNVREKVKRCIVDVERIKISQEIGKGNFGRVFRGVYNDTDGGRHDAAIKVVMNDNVKDKLEFLMEAVIMADFHHKNVLSLLAITIDDGHPYVVLPLMEYGDLRTFVANTNNVFKVRDLIDFAKQVADGMDYLSVQMKFVHRDLAARNCMVDKNLTVKVADFGLARDIYENDYYRPTDANRPLPIKWMALECLAFQPKFTSKSDVWSFGILLWELLMRGEKPYRDVSPQHFRRYLEEGNRLLKPDAAPTFVYDVMLQCWDADPDRRPTFSDIGIILQEFLDKTTSPAGAAASNINHSAVTIEAQAYRPSASTQVQQGQTQPSVVIPIRDLAASSDRNSLAVDNSYIDLSVN